MISITIRVLIQSYILYYKIKYNKDIIIWLYDIDIVEFYLIFKLTREQT